MKSSPVRSVDEISQYVGQGTISETQSGDRHIFAQSAQEHNVSRKCK